jgi:hypothetical protein
LIEERGDELLDESLLISWELGCLLEHALESSDGSWLSDSGERSLADDVVDGDAEDLGELGQDVGARRLVARLPERDGGLRNVDGERELGLT